MPITDTLETSRRLQQAGVPAKQAEVFSELFEETAKATQQDLKAFIVEQLAAFEARLEARMDARFAQWEAKMEARFSQMEGRIAQSEARSESRSAQIEARLLREMRQQVIWIFGLQIAIATVIVAAVRLLFF